MTTMRFEYQISISDYHSALYFGSTIRYQRLIQIFLVVAVVAGIYSLGGVWGFWPMSMLPAYIFSGYLVWVLFLLGTLEHGALKYLKSPNNMLQKTIILTFDRQTLKMETPDNGKSSMVQLDNLFMVFELSRMFLIYFDSAQNIILPLRAVSASDRVELRELFRSHINDRFQSRFGFTKAPKMQSLGPKKRFF